MSYCFTLMLNWPWSRLLLHYTPLYISHLVINDNLRRWRSCCCVSPCPLSTFFSSYTSRPRFGLRIFKLISISIINNKNCHPDQHVHLYHHQQSLQTQAHVCLIFPMINPNNLSNINLHLLIIHKPTQVWSLSPSPSQSSTWSKLTINTIPPNVNHHSTQTHPATDDCQHSRRDAQLVGEWARVIFVKANSQKSLQ